MATLEEALRPVTTITFDCYGTLIDWRGGIESSLLAIFGKGVIHRMPELFETYVEIEKQVEAEGHRRYRDVLFQSVGRLADRFGLGGTRDQCGRLAELLPAWPPFHDTNEALTRLKRRYRLGVLSNIDRDLFAGTAAAFSVPFDFVITAEDVGSYKPAAGHFEWLLRDHAAPSEVVHVAQSLYHDGAPASQLGLAYVWINRYNDANESAVCPLMEFPDLTSFANAACGGK